MRALAVILALVALAGCATLRPGVATDLPFPSVASVSGFTFQPAECTSGDTVAAGQQGQYVVLLSVEGKHLVRFMVIDFTVARVWLGTVLNDDRFQVTETLSLPETIAKYPDACDFLVVHKGQPV